MLAASIKLLKLLAILVIAMTRLVLPVLGIAQSTGAARIRQHEEKAAATNPPTAQEIVHTKADSLLEGRLNDGLIGL
ncbi:MAG TPA: hypothetical protein VHU83_11585 [Bryobacteraceae bacterium]|jgi:Mg2+/Co2+ transporter CorB|nr:hypothetical protein [Bryobacteraceae bacterium]